MNKNADRIKNLEQAIYENRASIKTGTQHGEMDFEDVDQNIKDEIMWLINHAKEQAKTIEKLREAYDLKTRVHDRVNRDLKVI